MVILKSLDEALGRLVKVGSEHSWVFCQALNGLEVTGSIVRPRVTPRVSGDLSMDRSVSVLLKLQFSSLENGFSFRFLPVFLVEWEDSVHLCCQIVWVVLETEF